MYCIDANELFDVILPIDIYFFKLDTSSVLCFRLIFSRFTCENVTVSLFFVDERSIYYK